MDHKWLKAQFRLNPDKGKADLALALGLEPPAVSKILAGTRQIKASEYNIMRRFFGLPVDGEKAAMGKAPSGKGSYVLQPLQERKGSPSEDSWVIPAELMKRRTGAAPGQVRVFPVQDDTMIPDFMPGEHVLVDTSDTKPSPPGIFVVSDGVGHIVRQCEVVPHSTPVQIRLRARNSKYDTYTLTLKKAGVIGRVIAKLEWL